MIWFTLLYWMLWAAVVMSVVATMAAWSLVLEDYEVNFKTIIAAVAGTFLSIFLGWSIWAVYPYSTLALGS